MTSTTGDGARLLRLAGDYDGENSLSVYWSEFETTFRARLSPTHGGGVLTITSITEVRFDGEEFLFPGTETDLQECPFVHVPRVIREAVERPVQYPAEATHG